MITINGLENNIIDLGEKQTHFEFYITSKNDVGKDKLWGVELVTSDFITVKPFSVSSLSIDIDAPNVLKEEYILLKNDLKERVKIRVIPDEYYTMEKTYKFKITKKVFEDDGSLTIKILSTVNDMELGWECTYDGEPLSYDITPFSSNGSNFVTIVLKSEIYNEANSVIEFTQNESNNNIRLNLYNTPEGIKKKVD